MKDGRELEVAAPGSEPPLARGAAVRIEWSPDDVILVAESAPRSGGGASRTETFHRDTETPHGEESYAKASIAKVRP